MHNPVIVKFQKLDPRAHEPTRAYDNAAGWDLYALSECWLYPGEPQIVPVGIAVEIPEGYFGWIVGRSSASKRGLAVLPGIIDSDYRGEIGPRVTKMQQVTVYTSDEAPGRTEHRVTNPERIEVGERVAQLLILPHVSTSIEETDTLSSTVRGKKGHGSTGK